MNDRPSMLTTGAIRRPIAGGVRCSQSARRLPVCWSTYGMTGGSGAGAWE
jgi:hypothetical protein